MSEWASVVLLEQAFEQAATRLLVAEPYLDDWCADPTLAHHLCANSACGCPCHQQRAEGQDEPMSDEQLQNYLQWADDARRVNTFWSGQYSWTVSRLVAEVERQREVIMALSQAYQTHIELYESEVAAMRQIVRMAAERARKLLGESENGESESEEGE